MSNLRGPWEYEEPNCAEVGVDIFFNIDKDDPRASQLNQHEYALAKKICDACDHKFECAEWGVENELHGMWGGLTPQDRNRIRKSKEMGLKLNRIN